MLDLMDLTRKSSALGGANGSGSGSGGGGGGGEEGDSLYEFMGLTKRASDGEIRSSFRRLALQWHPDRNPGAGPDDASTIQFRTLIEAYATLGDPKVRGVVGLVSGG